MAIYDCFQYFDEDHMVDLRLNILNQYVDYFVISESTKTHQGSGNLHSLVSANALTYLAPGTTAITGQKIDVILL